MESKNIGKVVQIVGAVVDIRFEKDSLLICSMPLR